MNTGKILNRFYINIQEDRSVGHPVKRYEENMRP